MSESDPFAVTVSVLMLVCGGSMLVGMFGAIGAAIGWRAAGGGK